MEGPAVSGGKEQPVPGAGEGDKGETPFLFHGGRGQDLPGRKNPFIHAAEEYCRKFQPFGSMDRHQFHPVSGRTCIGIGEKRRMGQIVRQCQLFPAGGFIIINGLFQLRQIVQPFLAAFRAEYFFIAALVENGSQNIGNRPPLAGRGRKGIKQLQKTPGTGPAEQRFLQTILQGLTESSPDGRHIPPDRPCAVCRDCVSVC